MSGFSGSLLLLWWLVCLAQAVLIGAQAESAIHQILGAIWALTATVAFVGAVVVFVGGSLVAKLDAK